MDVNDHVRDLFEAALEGRLSAEDEGRLESHLVRCSECEIEFRFARRVRETPGPTGEELSPEALARLKARVASALARPSFREPPAERSRRLVPVPALASGMAAALFLLWFSTGVDKRVAWLAAKPSLDVSAVRGNGEVRKLQIEELGEVMADRRSHRAPALVADFELAADLYRVVVAGSVQPSLCSPARSGMRALCLSRGGTFADPVEVRIEVAAGGGILVPAAVSAWVLCGRQPATVGLSAGLFSGGVCRASPARRVRPGGWRWVVFSLSREEIDRGQGVVDLRLEVVSAGRVAVDRIEMWKEDPR